MAGYHAPHVVRPQARSARILALALSVMAVGFTVGFGIYARRWYRVFDALGLEASIDAVLPALVFVLFAFVFRIAASICELVWLERTWSNLPESLRKIGPIERVGSGLVIGLSVVPGISWVWKLALVMAVSDGFERMRRIVPFRASVPRGLGMAAVILAWLPGLNVYVAPFLWEVFATRIDVVCGELLSAQGGATAQVPGVAQASPTAA